MYKKIKMFVFLIILMTFLSCSKDKVLYESTDSADLKTEVDKDSQTGFQTNDFTEQINKLKELARLTAKEWNPEVANYFYNYFSQTKQHGIELSEFKIKLEQEDNKQNNIIQLFSELTDVHLDAKDGPHPIEIYIPKDHLSLLEQKSPIFVFYDPTKDEVDNKYSIGFLSDGSSIEVDNNQKPKDRPAIVFRFKERINGRSIVHSNDKQSQEQISSSLKKTAGNCNEKFFLSEISFKNEGALGEPWIIAPPEYYTKTWPCLSPTSCSTTWDPQTRDVEPTPDWSPPLEFEEDFENWKWFTTYDWNYMMFDHTGGSLYYPRLKVEVWEEDMWNPDDMIDRCMSPTATVILGWQEWQSNGAYGYCKIKIKRYTW